MPKVVDLDSSRLQVGQIVLSTSATPAFGTLICDGSAISRTQYSDLFNVIGEAYGAGDGVSTFNIPDLRARSPMGNGLGPGLTSRSLGTSFGAETHTLTLNQTPVHQHPGTAASAGGHQHTYTYTTVYTIGSDDNTAYQARPTRTSGSGGSHAHVVTISNSGGGAAHSNMAPCLVGLFVIAFK